MDTNTQGSTEIAGLTHLQPSSDGAGGGGARNSYARMPRQHGKPAERVAAGAAVQVQLSAAAASRLGQEGTVVPIKPFQPPVVYAPPRPQVRTTDSRHDGSALDIPDDAGRRSGK